MSQLLYFVPDYSRPTMSADEAEKAGLGHATDGVSPTMRSGAGPGNQQGALVGFGDVKLMYKPEEQVWRAGELGENKTPRWYVGYWKNARPVADDLIRSKPVGGIKMRLLDDQDYVIPVASARFGHLSLPQRMHLNDEGKWVGRALDRYEYLCQKSADAFDLIYKGYMGDAPDDTGFEFDTLMAIVEPALLVNYRVGRYEIDLLGLIGDNEIWDILQALCDWQSFIGVMKAREKKPEASGT